jgi:hypothetical protein
VVKVHVVEVIVGGVLFDAHRFDAMALELVEAFDEVLGGGFEL